MRRAFLIGLLLWFPVQDLVLASLYAGTGSTSVAYARFVRDGLCVLFAALAFVKTRLPRPIFLSITIYSLFVMLYMPVGAIKGVPLGVNIATAGILLLPIILTLVGYYCHRSTRDVVASCWVLIIIGILSTLFGFWEIGNTDFWINTVRYGDYLRDIKGVLSGHDPHSDLPWNFFGYQFQRRAAGVLSAPLAQGTFLAVTSLVAIAVCRGRRLWLGLLLSGLLAVGIFESGTRGAMLMAVMAFLAYFLLSSRSASKLLVNLPLAFFGAVAVAGALAEVVSYTVGGLDLSIIGHIRALQINLAEVHTVLLVGKGVGRQGAIAAQEGLDTVGGGEGALFTIAFQLGVPGAIAFLWFYYTLFKGLFAGGALTGRLGEISSCLAALCVGVASTFVTSEHILTFSGMAAFWLLAGGALRVVQEHVTGAARTEAASGGIEFARARPSNL